MKFLLDENFPKASLSFLIEHGHDCLDFRDIGPKGANDNELFAVAIKENAVLLTTDRDFFHTIPYLFPEHPGVVVIALRQPNRQNILKKLEWFLNEFGNRVLQNCILELRDNNYISH